MKKNIHSHRLLYRKLQRVKHKKGQSYREKELICANCGAIFPEYLARCPECGSEEWKGLVEVNPYTRLPMEHFLKICGHLLWLLGTVGCLVCLWQTGGEDASENTLYIFGAALMIVCGILFSAAYFSISEILRRILRIQRRLQAFHETYRQRHDPGKSRGRL